MNNLLTKLNFIVDINELREYYKTLEEQYSNLQWNWEKSKGNVVQQWYDAAHEDAANLLTYGWAIQSNLKDLSLPCPPWNISTLETTDYRNTELAFGIIKRLQKQMPYAYRWSVSVQPKGGKVSLHSDQEDEVTVWIPVYTDGVAITFVTPEKTTGLCLESDGSAYMLDTTVPHFTTTNSDSDRVAVIFRLNKEYIPRLLEVTGKL